MICQICEEPVTVEHGVAPEELNTVSDTQDETAGIHIVMCEECMGTLGPIAMLLGGDFDIEVMAAKFLRIILENRIAHGIASGDITQDDIDEIRTSTSVGATKAFRVNPAPKKVDPTTLN
jgi:hypothetical protein